MALFDKLFSTKRKLDDNHGSRDRTRSCKVTSERVRLLLFKECDWKGRKLLFDSSTIEKIPNGKNTEKYSRKTENPPYIIEMAKDFAYIYKGPAADASAVGEMIFGAVAINYKCVSFKIHIMEEPSRLVCSKVFSVPYAKKNKTCNSKVSTNKLERDTVTDKMDLASSFKQMCQTDEGVSLSFSFDRGDSGFYGDHSPQSSISSTSDYCSKFNLWDRNSSREDFCSFNSPPSRKLSSCSNGSWQRRAYRRMSTKFDISCQSSNSLTPTTPVDVTSYDSQLYSNSTCSGTNESLASGTGSGTGGTRRGKLGLAVLITLNADTHLDAVTHCLEQSPRLRALVRRLRFAALSAGLSRGCFVATLHAAAEDAAVWVSDLLYGPRVSSAWLALASASESDHRAENVLTTLCNVLAHADTKYTNFFISTLLTYVLTYHLGWVTTVSPYDSESDAQTPANVAGRPYNALWAQLSDLYGSIGCPPRVARTVLCGSTNIQLLNKLLFILTYFIRCGDVHRTDFYPIPGEYKETKIVKVNDNKSMKRTLTRATLVDMCTQNENISNSSSTNTLGNVSKEMIEKSCESLCINKNIEVQECGTTLKRNPTVNLPIQPTLEDSLDSNDSNQFETEQKVVFVLGDDDRLVGLKNKSSGGKRVKKSSKVQNEPVNLDTQDTHNEGVTVEKPCEKNCTTSIDSPSRCCAEKLQHSKPMKHSGFKFEFDKYPQIVTNYMKSKNLEILDRHYIGKPGNLKLDNFQFDPTVVPPIQEERCESCYKCQVMESMLQTPTNASELEFMSDMPGQAEPQYAKQEIVSIEKEDPSPKTFVRKRKQNTVIVNVNKCEGFPKIDKSAIKLENKSLKNEATDVTKVLEFPMPTLSSISESSQRNAKTAFVSTLLGGLTDHYVPDLVLQGTLAKPNVWESDLKRDLDLTAYVEKTAETSIQAVAIVGDTDTWQVSVTGGGCGGMSALVATMLDALPHMRKANVPARQCLFFIESKLRELCVLSKTLAEILMSNDFCDMSTLTRCLNVDVNDVPLLLAVATTHTPQLARRYGVSYR